MPYLVFMRSSGVGAALIRQRNRGWANHVGIAQHLYDQIIESVGGDIRPVQWAKTAWGKIGGLFGKKGWGKQKARGVIQARTIRQAMLDNEVRIFELPPTLPHLEEAAWQWLVDQIGKDYDHPGLVGFIPVPLPNGWETQSKREADARMFCSELAKGYADRRAGADYLRGTVEWAPALVLHAWVEPYRVDPEWLMSPGVLRELTRAEFPA